VADFVKYVAEKERRKWNEKTVPAADVAGTVSLGSSTAKLPARGA
jgi:hypothetical protein